METSKYFTEKLNVFHTIQETLENWDGSLEQAVEVLKKNEQHFKKMQALDNQLSAEEQKAFQTQHRTELQEMVEKQQQLMAVIQEEQTHLKKQLGQLGKKNKVVSNYMAIQKKSLFVEKDF